jgi:hypothetical protein
METISLKCPDDRGAWRAARASLQHVHCVATCRAQRSATTRCEPPQRQPFRRTAAEGGTGPDAALARRRHRPGGGTGPEAAQRHPFRTGGRGGQHRGRGTRHPRRKGRARLQSRTATARASARAVSIACGGVGCLVVRYGLVVCYRLLFMEWLLAKGGTALENAVCLVDHEIAQLVHLRPIYGMQCAARSNTQQHATRDMQRRPCRLRRATDNMQQRATYDPPWTPCHLRHAAAADNVRDAKSAVQHAAQRGAAHLVPLRRTRA